tara:strand:+ start:9042 stop:9521 length:480 start_codon:yes stop_codon:yes gene_type:complete
MNERQLENQTGIEWFRAAPSHPPHPEMPKDITVKSNTAERSDKAMRSNSGKVPMSHVLDFPRAMALLAEVAEGGAEKYNRGNFQKGQDASVTIDCLLRHLFKWWAGEDDDSESGKSHLGHVMWNATVLAEDMQRGIKQQDDRTFNDDNIQPIDGDTFTK